MSKKDREEIKKLQSIKASIEAEIETLELKEKNLKQEISTKKMNLNNLRQKINSLSKSSEQLTISEHAILRYIQRVMGLDIEEISSKILPQEEMQVVDRLGNGHYPINNGEFRIIVKNRVVITVYTDEDKTN